MLTPQEVSERAFPKASFGGYNMAQVDEFLDVLTEDYSVLYSENAVLKSKMKVLVEKAEPTVAPPVTAQPTVQQPAPQSPYDGASPERADAVAKSGQEVRSDEQQ